MAEAMGCKLTRQPNGGFRGPAEERVRIDVRSDQPASVVRIAYAGEQDGDPPFEFLIRQGENKLLVVALGAQDGQKITVVELEGENACPLKRFFWSRTHFHTTLDIEGI